MRKYEEIAIDLYDTPYEYAGEAIRELLKEINRLREASKWQPIETAPKDGTFVLVATKSGFICIRQWCTEGYWRKDLSRTINKPVSPTHWQSLPDPPRNPD